MPSHGRNTWSLSRIFFHANEIENEDKKRMIFLTSVGTDIFHLMKTLVAPKSLNTKSVAELADLVQNHLDPEPSKSVCRFKFNIAATGKQESL